MQHMRCININIAFFLTALALAHATLLTGGCTALNNREAPNAIYKGYNEPKLSREDVAFVWWDKSRGRIYTIDGKVVNEWIETQPATENRKAPGYVKGNYWGAELLPGQHTMEYFIWGHKSAPVTIRVDANLSPGHTYVFNSDYQMYAKHPRGYAISLIDEKTGALVAGRSPEVFKWSWSNWEQSLQRLKRNSATDIQVIELLSEPIDRLSDNARVYVVCPDNKKGRVIVSWHRAETIETIYNAKACGFLFLEFDKADSFQGYNFITVPFRECYRDTLKHWDTTALHKEAKACRSRLKNQGYTKFRTGTADTP